MQSSWWHRDFRRDVVVFEGLSVSVNSATSSRNNELKLPDDKLLFILLTKNVCIVK